MSLFLYDDAYRLCWIIWIISNEISFFRIRQSLGHVNFNDTYRIDCVIVIAKMLKINRISGAYVGPSIPLAPANVAANGGGSPLRPRTSPPPPPPPAQEASNDNPQTNHHQVIKLQMLTTACEYIYEDNNVRLRIHYSLLFIRLTLNWHRWITRWLQHFWLGYLNLRY